MQNALPVFARWMLTLSLAVWLGGLLAIGAIVAPVTAHYLDAHAVSAADPARRSELLTGIVGGSLRVFNPICCVCGGLMLLSQLLLWRTMPRRVAVAGVVIVLLLLGSAIYLGQGLFPAMDAAQASGQMARFDLLHKRYEAVSTQFQFPLLLILALLGAARGSR